MTIDYEREGRIRKARKLADELERRGVSEDAADAYDRAERNALARDLGVRVPSDETWALVVADLRLRDLLASIPPATDDEFSW